MYATSAIKAGDVIIDSEAPIAVVMPAGVGEAIVSQPLLVVLAARALDANPAAVQSLCRPIDSALGTEARARLQEQARQVRALLTARGDAGGTADEAECADALLRLACNVFALSDEGSSRNCAGLAVYAMASCLNHSCAPNATQSFCPAGRVTVTADRDVPAGEEVCVSYVDLTKAAWVRRRLLQEKYFFRCRCLRCSVPDANDTVQVPSSEAGSDCRCSGAGGAGGVRCGYLDAGQTEAWEQDWSEEARGGAALGRGPLDSLSRCLRDLSLPCGFVWEQLRRAAAGDTCGVALPAVLLLRCCACGAPVEVDPLPLLARVEAVHATWLQLQQQEDQQQQRGSHPRELVPAIALLERLVDELCALAGPHHYSVVQACDKLTSLLQRGIEALQALAVADADAEAEVEAVVVAVVGPDSEAAEDCQQDARSGVGSKEGGAPDLEEWAGRYVEYFELMMEALPHCYPKFDLLLSER